MRYPASEKLEIIRLVEQSPLGVRPTLEKLGIPKTTFYRWYDRYQAFSEVGLEDRNSHPSRVWNRIDRIDKPVPRPDASTVVMMKAPQNRVIDRVERCSIAGQPGQKMPG